MTRSRHRPDRNPATQQSPAVAEMCYPFCRKHGRYRLVKRREFVALLGGTATVWPLAAHAQQPAIPVIGFLGSFGAGDRPHHIETFRQGLSQVGYAEGRNLAI